jgi:hypothetical protein
MQYILYNNIYCDTIYVNGEGIQPGGRPDGH